MNGPAYRLVMALHAAAGLALVAVALVAVILPGLPLLAPLALP